MKHRLDLDYTLGAGALTPYLDALRDGRALAARRLRDGQVTFPPDRVFSAGGDGARDFDWVELPGRGTLAFRTDGPGGSFCLVRFDGADNRAVARILNPQASGNRVALQPTGDGLPGILVGVTGDDV